MDHLPIWIHDVLTHYGSFGLFILLALGIFGLPIPDETLLVLAGYFISKGKLPPALTAGLAISGSMVGITLSYLVGRTAGHSVILRYGKWIGITKAKLDLAHRWFLRIGKWMLLIGFYIPGVRHFTGIVAGSVSLDYWQFAIFSYIGAAIWVLLFLTIGYYLPNVLASA